MKTKICSSCKKEKPTKEFCVRKASKDGLHYQCKECKAERAKEWLKKSPVTKTKEYRNRRNETAKKYHKNNLEKCKERARKHRIDNPEKYREKKRKYQEEILQTAKGVIDHRMRGMTYKLLKGLRQDSPLLEIRIGYTAQQLRDHFESLLTPGMTRANYGTEWEIDHKIPLWSFDYSDIADPQFKKCWALDNLQPLWKGDNLKKGTKIA